METTKFKESQYIKNLIEVSLDPLIIINAEGKITDINETTVFFTGIEREKLIGSYFCDYFTEPQKACEVYLKTFANGSVIDSPLTLRHRNGKLTDVLFNGAVDKDDKRKVVGILIVVRYDSDLKLTSYYARILLESILDPLNYIPSDEQCIQDKEF